MKINPKLFKKSHKNFINLNKKYFFLKTDKPLLNTYNIGDLPDQESVSESVLQSRRTYTKWFNPNNFDPRTPDYINTVRSNWEEDPTIEDFGSGNFFILNKISISNQRFPSNPIF